MGWEARPGDDCVSRGVRAGRRSTPHQHGVPVGCLEKLFATLVLHAWTLWVHAARMWVGHEKRLAQIASLLSFFKRFTQFYKACVAIFLDERLCVVQHQVTGFFPQVTLEFVQAEALAMAAGDGARQSMEIAWVFGGLLLLCM